MQYIAGAHEENAELIYGGHRVREESGGYFVEPTIFRNVAPSARIAREEIFGPVLSTIAFDGDDEAIHIANDTLYGLAAYVWTADLTTGMRMARGVRASVIINSAPSIGEGAGYAASSEPMGQSGIGAQGGLAGLEQGDGHDGQSDQRRSRRRRPRLPRLSGCVNEVRRPLPDASLDCARRLTKYSV